MTSAYMSESEAARLSPTPDATDLARIQRTADFILSLQNEDGRIADDPESDVSNEDSNAEYALMGLAAAYEATGDQRYLTGLERGIGWLAARVELEDPKFRGSFFYTYETEAPYAPVPTSPGDGVDDVRGVDATSALFVHLLARHYEVTGRRDLVDAYKTQALAALDFVLRENRSDDGFFYSSWHNRDGDWQLWKYEYAADQGDVYLGLRAGADLYETNMAGPYTAAANFLVSHTSQTFFDSGQGRYAVGRDNGHLDGLDGIDGVFPQGYLPWIFGGHPSALSAFHWMRNGVEPDGSLALFEGDARYALSAEIFAMAAAALGRSAPDRTLDWLSSAVLDPETGGIQDSLQDDTTTSNIAGFALIALTGALPRSMWRNKVGGEADDRLVGQNSTNDVLTGLGGADRLKGLDGNDILIGGLSLDEMTGGKGRDIFVYNALEDSTPLSEGRDRITDFERRRDKIDLSTIDAVAGTPANEAFTFIGSRKFSGAKGELRAIQADKPGTSNDKTIVEADVDGDRVGDFRIDLRGLISLTKDDFIL